MADLTSEQFEDGSLLLIERKYKKRNISAPAGTQPGHWYSYAALKVLGRWFVTGTGAPRQGINDWEFKLWCNNHHATTRVYLAEEVTEL